MQTFQGLIDNNGHKRTITDTNGHRVRILCRYVAKFSYLCNVKRQNNINNKHKI